MVDFALTEAQAELKRVAHDFARNEVRPMAREVDRAPDPKASFPWDLYKKGNALGFNKALIPESYSGPGLGVLDFALITEELAWGDAGVAVTYVGHWLCLRPLILGGSEPQRRKWLPQALADPDGAFLAAIAATEHGVAADRTPREYLGATSTVAPGVSEADFFTNYTLPQTERREMTTRALADGDDFVINGMKRFVTNGPLASLYLVVATTNPALPDLAATAAFIVPKGAPGLSAGTIEDKMGHRLSVQSEVIFDSVRVPKEDMLPSEAESGALGYGLECSTTLVGALCVGLARAAYEAAIDYAKVRYKGGNRIIFHQAVGIMLADMAIGIKTARLLTHQAAWHADRRLGPSALGPMAKVFCSDMAVRVTHDATQVFGGYGYMRDLPLEKWERDARVTQIYDFTNEMLRVNIILPRIALSAEV
ncbi:MAG: acyl-CoA dehydrogenase family protein [Chloroflexi bacterium]|nr:acyl-CoA dehydrogenase family protein [Chloroflexota bacterium]